MKKKVTALIIAAAALLAVLAGREYMTLDRQMQRLCAKASVEAPNVLLYDMDNNEALFQKNTEERISVGSINKLMTVCVAMRYFSPDDVITVGEEVDLFPVENASRSGIKNGQMLTFRQLLTAMLLPSGCDAAYTVAVNAARRDVNDPQLESSRAVKRFCEMMNCYADEIGCTASHFVNPDGQDDPSQYTCVNDVLVFTMKALEYETVRDIVCMASSDEIIVSGERFSWVNTNRFVKPGTDYYTYYVYGGKTGSTDEAGYSIASYAVRNGCSLLAVVCGCEKAEYRYDTALKLFKLGFFKLGIYQA